MHWTVLRVVEATRGKLVQGNPDRLLREISTDTRRLGEGDCFVALVGEVHDAHDFIGAALAGKAHALVVSRPMEDLNVPIPADVAVIQTPDTLVALGALARVWRLDRSIPVAGITGSNGKTSTKEMVAGILSLHHDVLKNQGNFNNLIGAPLTLLSLRPHHQVAVVEMGINTPGEMARLVEIACPTAGLITNIHPAHLEGLGSLDRILSEKGKLWEGLGSDGLAAVNLDDERLAGLSKTLGCRTVTYSLTNPLADVRVGGTVGVDDEVSVFDLLLGDCRVSIRLPVLGMHQVQNAVAAAALAWGMGESAETIARGLEAHRPVKQRMQMHHLPNGCVLVDDTYNANPKSMLAAVEAVLAASRENPFIAVLGEMRELGPDSPSLHREMGRRIGALGIARLITLGEMGKEICLGAMEVGMSPGTCFHAQNHEEIVKRLLEEQVRNAWIVVKGSRGMTMERVVEGILAQ